MVHVDQLWLGPCHQDRTNWIRDEMAHRDEENVANRRPDHLLPQFVIVGSSVACQTCDMEPIVTSDNNKTPKVTVRRSSRRKQRPIRLVYYRQI